MTHRCRPALPAPTPAASPPIRTYKCPLHSITLQPFPEDPSARDKKKMAAGSLAMPALLVALLACATARAAVVAGQFFFFFYGFFLSFRCKRYGAVRGDAISCRLCLLLCRRRHGVRRGDLRHGRLQGAAADHPFYQHHGLRVRLLPRVVLAQRHLAIAIAATPISALRRPQL